jgi:hypothetical protein
VLVHNPFAAIASTICLVFSGSLEAANTCAAASRALTFLVLGSGLLSALALVALAG